MANPDRKPESHADFENFQPPREKIEAAMKQVAAGDLHEIDEFFDKLEVHLKARHERKNASHS